MPPLYLPLRTFLRSLKNDLSQTCPFSSLPNFFPSLSFFEEKKMWPQLVFDSSQPIASAIDQTLLKADASLKEIEHLCNDALHYKFASVCVNSAYIQTVANLLNESSVRPVAVVGFPLGASTSASKAFEASEAIELGAQEIDMVLSIGALKNGDHAKVLSDIQAVVRASAPFPVKVILETALLNREEKIKACTLAQTAGAAFVKTSTGFSPGGGAVLEDVKLMRRMVGNRMGVKASGGIKTYEDAIKMLEAGANRIGTSAGVAIAQGEKQKKPGHPASTQGKILQSESLSPIQNPKNPLY